MFSRAIPSDRMKLTSEMANNIFNIRGDFYNGDATFLATMRALLGKRVPDRTPIYFRFTRSSLDSYRLDNLNYGIVRKLFAVDQNEEFNGNEIWLHSLEANQADNDKAMTMLDTDMASHGFESKEDLRAFFASRKIVGRFYINSTIKTTVIVLAGCMCHRTMHVLQTMMPRYFKWYFDPAAGTGLTDKEKDLIRSLAAETPDEYERLINEFAKEYDFRSFAIKSICGDFEGRVIRDELAEKRNEFTRLQRGIQDMLRDYHQRLDSIDSLNTRIMGLEAKLHNQSEQNALADYFTACKNLLPIRINDGALTFVVQTYLTNFSPDMWDTIGSNDHSHFYNDYNYTSEWDDINKRRKLLAAIFSDEAMLKIKVCGVYEMTTRGYVRTYSGYDYPDECKDFMPNPHLHYFNCLGGHEPLINERLGAHDYVGAVVQCMGSAGSINLSEGVTVRNMLGDQIFNGTNKKFIELPDGTSVTPSEAYEWLVKNEEGANA